MSYEGSIEYICPTGHYLCVDVYDGGPERCLVCGEPFEWQHSIDHTNGVDEESLELTDEAPKVVVGHYPVHVPLYAPGPGWSKASELLK